MVVYILFRHGAERDVRLVLQMVECLTTFAQLEWINPQSDIES